ncbi:SH3 domain-containing protein [Clostridium sp. MSJ-11]|uniref:SH3 domain-containing protein n=1 Tax=Clostridium mobile TaxID=2841512 RepID=A0ABS6EEK9_9CLOT|nr:SH3 domain-containing protein [Clostridium mobile]MBU5483217.1 SH3 domain-containing protein [Clostridium mobile]
MKKFKLKSILAIFFTTIISTSVYAAGENHTQFKSNVPKVTEDMMKADFWIKNAKDKDKIIMDKASIEKYNKELEKKTPEVVDLKNYKEVFNKEELTKLIKDLSSPSSSPRYDKDGKLITEFYYNKLNENLNLESLKEENQVKYGITVRRTLMKTYPTHELLFKEGDDYEFDRLMETAVYPLEPIVILNTSKDKKWYFAQMYNYLAWIPAEDVAITSKDELFKYIDTKDFLVATGKRAFTVYNPLDSNLSEIKFDMGVRIPLASQKEIGDEVYGQNTTGNYVVKLPIRDDSGKMVLKYALIPRSEDVNIGYLPYTKETILNQAFKFLGERYGWGGMFNGRDCSSFIMDIYRSVGINLPRNTGEQGRKDPGKSYDMPKEMTLEQRQKLFDDMNPGAAMYMPGHAMLYLGKYNGEHYMIHDFSGFYNKEKDGSYKYYKSRQVMVTPVTIGSEDNGKTYLEDLYLGKEFILDK